MPCGRTAKLGVVAKLKPPRRLRGVAAVMAMR